MGHRIVRDGLLAAGLAALVALAGCGGGEEFATLAAGPPATRAMLQPASVTLVPFGDQWPDALPRTVDIGDKAYKSGFLRSDGNFPAAGSPSVVLTYDQTPVTPYFVGHITASGLKPNFAYQMKLMGKPGSSSDGLWPGAADMTANERLLTAGRWWNYRTEESAFTTPDSALTSADYQAGWVPGYIYFGVFVTNGYGAYDGPIAAAQSYHITWKTGQSGPRDVVLGWFTLNRYKSYGYTTNGSASVELWYEKEPNDPLDVVLPEGSYDVVLMITEEAFHGYKPGRYAGGGWWETVLVSDWPSSTSPRTGQPWVAGRGGPITFTIADMSGVTMSTAVDAAWRYNGRKYQPKAWVTVTGPSGPVAGATVNGKFTGAHTGTVSAVTNADGYVEFYGPPNWRLPNKTFVFTVTGVTADGLTWTGSEAADTANANEVVY